MKRILKLVKWSMVICVTTFIIGISSLFIYIETSIDKALTKEDQRLLLKDINGAQELPPIFYETTEKYFPYKLKRNTYSSYFNSFFLEKRDYSCSCNNIYIRAIVSRNNSYIKYHFTHPIIIQRFVERNCTQKQCLTYQMYSKGMSMRADNIEDACKIYFKKKLNEITEIEVIKLHFMQKANYKFDPISNPDNLEKAVQATLNKAVK